jgi:nitrite reductase/ring-hydroxylating ferredoxin subunit
MRRTRADIVLALEAQGLRFRTFSLVLRSPHSIEDWDWNQRDLPHIPLIHGGFRLVPAAVDDELAVGLYVQEILGVRMPLVVSFHHGAQDERARVYEATLGPLALVIGARLEPLAGGTEVTTTYSVGSPSWARPLLPLAERILRRNAERLQREDVPLVERRTQLRSWGYRFASDGEGASYRRSLDLGRANVIVPSGEVRPEYVPLGDGRREILVGRDDHLGLRVLQSGRGGGVSVYPRMCAHEGASLDGCPVEGGVIRCPWHGRRIAALATFDLARGDDEARETAHHRLAIVGGTMSIAPVVPISSRCPSIFS